MEALQVKFTAELKEVRRAINRIASALESLALPPPEMIAEAEPEPDTTHSYGEPDTLGRVPMGPQEFYGSCSELERKLDEAGIAWERTSGIRTEEGNAQAGATPQSKHRCDPSIARDYELRIGGLVLGRGSAGPEMAVAWVRELGPWATYHDTGSGPHLHTQGLPVGPIHPQWLADHATEETKAWAAEVYS